jgi:hypothetical protein
VLIELDRLCQLYNEDFTHRDTNTPQKYISQGRSEAYKHAISLVKQLGGEQK